MAKFWKFNGGLQLSTKKDLSRMTPLVKAVIPEQLIYPLQQRPGIIAKSLVKPGDQVLRGQLIASPASLLGAPIHAASSGTVSAIENHLIAHPSGLTDQCIVIATDGKDEALEFHGEPDYLKLTPDVIRNRIQQAGIVGLGGAAFPTAVKLNPGLQRNIDTLIINGAECEPYITCDDRLMQDRSEHVISGILILLHVLQIKNCIIAVENDMPEAQHALQQELDKIVPINQQSHFKKIEIRMVPALYPIGGEKQLIRVITGKEIASDGIPADVGVICQNVGTVAAVYNAIIKGLPIIERVVTITGNGVRNQQNMLVRIGTPIKDLISQCGGYNDQVERLIMGGPMMGFALPNDDIPIVKASNCILAADRSEISNKKSAMPCIRCGDCASVCPVTLLPQQLYWHSRADNLSKVKEYRLFDCIECGCCEIVCPSHIPLVQYYRASKNKIILKNQEAEQAALAKHRYDQQVLRKQRQQTERAETIRKQKEALAKKKTAIAKAAADTATFKLEQN